VTLCSREQLLKHVLWGAIMNAIKDFGFSH
jgi:hypothetical protein